MFPTARKWLKRFAILLGILVVLIIVEWQYTLRRTNPRLETIKAKLDKTEPGWQLEALSEKRNESLPRENQNIASFVRISIQQIPESFREWEQNGRWYSWQEDLEAGRLLHPDYLDELSIHVLEFEPTLIQLQAIRRLKRGGTEIDFHEPSPLETGLPHLGQFSSACRCLEWKILNEANCNRPVEALDACRTLLHIRLAIGDEPTLSSQCMSQYLIDRAIDATILSLGLTEPPIGLSELQAEFTAAAKEQSFLEGINGDRAMIDRTMQNYADGKIDNLAFWRSLGMVYLSNKTDGQLYFVFARRYAKPIRAVLLEIYTATRDAMKKSGLERKTALATVPYPPVRDATNYLVFWITSELQRHCEHRIRFEARLACMIVALACERYRLRTGSWPAALTDIPKFILPEVPSDPYVGGPVKLRRTDSGIVIYSTGPDEIDDGGVTLSSNSRESGADSGLSLVDPSHRRKPPMSKKPDDK